MVPFNIPGALILAAAFAALLGLRAPLDAALARLGLVELFAAAAALQLTCTLAALAALLYDRGPGPSLRDTYRALSDLFFHGRRADERHRVAAVLTPLAYLPLVPLAAIPGAWVIDLVFMGPRHGAPRHYLLLIGLGALQCLLVLGFALLTRGVRRLPPAAADPR